MIARAVRHLDERTGTAPFLRKALRYVFPDHWTFMLGEIALYCFVVLVATGVYLTLFFEPSLDHAAYDGSYAPLRGQEVSAAYRSVVDLSLEVRAGLLIRQTHHWAALVFVAAVTLHLARVLFTGAFRRPRELTWYVGVTMLALAVLEGFMGYSLADDLLSGMGLAIAYSVVASLPLVGGNLATLLWGGEFPGGAHFLPRLYAAHVLLLPVAIGTLLALHLALVALTKHTQWPGGRARERAVVGTPLWPGYLLRTLSLGAAVAAVLVLLGGLVQVNPVWQWGPYEPWLSTNGAQPDWYLGWLIGALRLMPGVEPQVAGHVLAATPFWGGALFPLVVFGILYAWPRAEKRLTGDRAEHHVLDRPRDAPGRTAAGVAFFTWIGLVFAFGSADRVFVELHVPYVWQLWIFRGAVLVVPPLAAWLAFRVCRELAASEAHPLRGSPFVRVRRNAAGGYSASRDSSE